MTPISDNSPLNQFNFGNLKGRKITANFSGGRITSDAGIIWLAELDKKLKITEKFADCFQRSSPSLLCRLSGSSTTWRKEFMELFIGYEDVNDHEHLRYDSALAIALERLDFIDSNTPSLAGKSTINRLEYCPETVLNQAESRYYQIEHQPQEIEKTFVEIFLNS
jgi:hypothetical protein